MEKNKIIGAISIVLFIIGWILYSKIGVIFSLVIEIGALILAIISEKKQKNIFATIGIVGSTILIIIMMTILLGTEVSTNVGDDALINKAIQIQESN